jgi:hypothetical protein
VEKRLSRDGKRDDSETPTSVVLCNLRIVPEYFCSSGDAHPSVITVDILMCLMFEKRTAHAKSKEAGGSIVHPFQGDAAPPGGVGTELERASTSTNKNGGVLGQPQRRKTFWPGLICAASRFLYRCFGGTGRGEGALTRRTWTPFRRPRFDREGSSQSVTIVVSPGYSFDVNGVPGDVINEHPIPTAGRLAWTIGTRLCAQPPAKNSRSTPIGIAFAL